MPKPLADWQLPPGVNRGLWDYFHDAQLVRDYDTSLQDSRLVKIDREFVEKYCESTASQERQRLEYQVPASQEHQRLEYAPRIIDLGCGTGRMLVPLAQRGFWPLGVDLSDAMLTSAAEKASRANAHVQLLKANLVELDCLRDASFRYAICLFSTFGMILGNENRLAMLRHVHRILEPGGRFILHVHNRWFNFWHPNGRRWLLKDCVRRLRQSPQQGDCVMPVHDGQSSLTLHLFTRREIQSLVRKAGFHLLELRAISLREDGQVRHPWFFGGLRTYGYLLALEKPHTR